MRPGGHFVKNVTKNLLRSDERQINFGLSLRRHNAGVRHRGVFWILRYFFVFTLPKSADHPFHELITTLNGGGYFESFREGAKSSLSSGRRILGSIEEANLSASTESVLARRMALRTALHGPGAEAQSITFSR